MKTSINLTGLSDDVGRYSDREDLRHFYKDKGIDGIELMLCGCKDIPEPITREDVNGIHLKCYPGWIDFWRGDWDALMEEYGDESVVETVFGGRNPEDMLKPWKEELEIAHRSGVQYVVFHVSECVLEECITYRFRHTDEEVCDAACQIINELLDGMPYGFYFLTENLWWSGFTFTRPEITRRLMDGIHYPHKGIMLDTGHLLHTELSLKTQDEGVAYIHSMLDRNGDLCRYIRGVHLNQSLSGDYVKSVIANPPELTGDYWERLCSLYLHIFKIDSHLPFTAPGVAPLIRRIAPEFVTVELITQSREALNQALMEQMKALHDGGGIGGIL